MKNTQIFIAIIIIAVVIVLASSTNLLSPAGKFYGAGPSPDKCPMLIDAKGIQGNGEGATCEAAKTAAKSESYKSCFAMLDLMDCPSYYPECPVDGKKSQDDGSLVGTCTKKDDGKWTATWKSDCEKPCDAKKTSQEPSSPGEVSEEEEIGWDII